MVLIAKQGGSQVKSEEESLKPCAIVFGLSTPVCSDQGTACGALGMLQTEHPIIVGGGHNGLVAAALLGRQGLQVDLFEEKSVVGGAVKTEYPFEKVPGLGPEPTCWRRS